MSDAGDGKTAHYVRAFDVYEFHEDGTGSFYRHFIGEKATAPEISWGNGGNGDFIDTYGLLIRFTGYILGKYGEAYVTGMIAGDHRDLVQVPAFANCGNISPNLMTYHIIGIDNWAFKGHDHIKTLTVSPDCLYIGPEAFRDCTGLVSAQLNPAKLGDRAFMGCTSLETVSIAPACTLNKIGYEAFRYCVNLVSVAIPIGIRKIGKKAFADCSSLSSVCPYQFEYHTEMTDDAFEHTPKLHKHTVKK